MLTEISYNVQYPSCLVIQGLTKLHLLSCLNSLFISWNIFLLTGILWGPGRASDDMPWTVDRCKVDSGDTDGVFHFGLLTGARGCHGWSMVDYVKQDGR